jgi:hypothetical protein
MAARKVKPAKAQPKEKTPADEAKALAAPLVQPFTGDYKVVFSNASTGARSLKNAGSVLSSLLKDWNPARATQLAQLASDFRDAAAAVDNGVPKQNPELQQDLLVAWPLRRLLLLQARVGVELGVLADDKVNAIVKGKGSLDAAQDLLDLSSVLSSGGDALAKKVHVSAEQLAQANVVGRRLLSALKPSRTRRVTDSELVKLRNTRDRLFTLLTLTHAELWSFAALVFGKEHVDQAYPSLFSVEAHAKRNEAKAAAKAADAAKATNAARKVEKPVSPDEPLEE